ncbi:MAG TPA: winged helix-turn-helix domain-containing protein [Candidatus Korarchaeota archaeon]|nr:winged helix-turn-helix domain-containing protein [Candidatus Korarchaeota archaeon]
MGAKEWLEGKIAKIEIRTSSGMSSFRIRVPKELKDSWNELTRLKRESKESRDAGLLRCIKESCEGISMDEISRKTSIPRSTVCSRIREFEEKGWVKNTRKTTRTKRLQNNNHKGR